ncbi:MAG: NADH-quinone oxidoreductase subunit H [Chloroflexi bacterium RBG_13_51_52]|nr:MAG: NADH-quinone oxidoreductase subunit H [Chloroflexi bacterium RBG_13_51_52]
MQVTPPDWPGGYWWHWLFFTVAIIAFVLIMVMGAIYLERRGMGRMQSRLGPNRTGPFGLLQPVADAVKVLLKENIVPTTADKIVHWLAPVVAFAPVLVIFAVVPFQNGAMLADLNIGILYVVAVSSIATVGVFMAGWGSGNKYSLLGAMRNVAAVVSYEIPMVLAIVGVVIVSGSLSMNQIVTGQDIPYILVQPLGFLIFFIAACAEINRSPFDLMEADSELTAGFHTEYSGMKFAMFYLVEYAEAIAMSAIIATLFLSGWRGPWLPPWLWFIIKTFVVFFVMVWTRTTLPRVRIDQLMGLAWKFLFPLALINLFVTAIQVVVWPDISQWIFVIVNIAIAAVLILLWSKFFKLGQGRVEV